MAKKEKTDKTSETILKNLKGFAKKGSEMKDSDFVSTGHYELDLAICHGVSPDDEDFDINKFSFNDAGGLPTGKLVELSGSEGSGKSSLAYRIVGIAQKKEMKCLWIDVEHSFSKTLANINGVNLDELYVSELIDVIDEDHMYSAEEVFDRICDACESGFKVIVLDSVANLVTKAELEHYMSEPGVGIGQLPQALSKGLRKIINYAYKHDVLVIFINQIREKMGVMFGSNESTPGGRALKHLASVRLKMQKGTGENSRIEDEVGETGIKKVIGGKSYVYILKNRLGAPITGSIVVPVYYTPYFPEIEDIIFNCGRQLQVIRKYKDTFNWGELKVVGKKGFIEAIKKDNLVNKLSEEIFKVAEEQKVPLPPEVLRCLKDANNAEITKDDSKDDTTVSRKRKTKHSTVGTEGSEE